MFVGKSYSPTSYIACSMALISREEISPCYDQPLLAAPHSSDVSFLIYFPSNSSCDRRSTREGHSHGLLECAKVDRVPSFAHSRALRKILVPRSRNGPDPDLRIECGFLTSISCHSKTHRHPHCETRAEMLQCFPALNSLEGMPCGKIYGTLVHFNLPFIFICDFHIDDLSIPIPSNTSFPVLASEWWIQIYLKHFSGGCL